MIEIAELLKNRALRIRKLAAAKREIANIVNCIILVPNNELYQSRKTKAKDKPRKLLKNVEDIVSEVIPESKSYNQINMNKSGYASIIKRLKTKRKMDKKRYFGSPFKKTSNKMVSKQKDIKKPFHHQITETDANDIKRDIKSKHFLTPNAIEDVPINRAKTESLEKPAISAANEVACKLMLDSKDSSCMCELCITQNSKANGDKGNTGSEIKVNSNLPLKKRKLIAGSSKEEICYPATPMLSIAAIKDSMCLDIGAIYAPVLPQPKVQPVECYKFKTPAQLKLFPTEPGEKDFFKTQTEEFSYPQDSQNLKFKNITPFTRDL